MTRSDTSGRRDDDPRFALSEEMIGELEAADYLVIGTPMNNFSVPSTLKAWIDHIVRIRRTFRSTPEGKIGTLRDRPVFVVSAHGGPMSGGYQPDFMTDYLRAIFETIGIRQVHFLCADGLSRGPEAVAKALDQAKTWIDERRLRRCKAAPPRRRPGPVVQPLVQRINVPRRAPRVVRRVTAAL